MGEPVGITIEEHEHEMDALKERIARIHDREIDELKKKISLLEENLVVLTEDFNETKAELKDIKYRRGIAIKDLYDEIKESKENIERIITGSLMEK